MSVFGCQQDADNDIFAIFVAVTDILSLERKG